MRAAALAGLLLLALPCGAAGEEAVEDAARVIYLRNLFDPSRSYRPPEDERTAAQELEALRREGCLCGVVVMGGYRRALFKPRGKAGLRLLKEGDRLGEWTVERIRPGQVVLRRGERTVRVKAFGGLSPAPSAVRRAPGPLGKHPPSPRQLKGRPLTFPHTGPPMGTQRRHKGLAPWPRPRKGPERSRSLRPATSAWAGAAG